MTLQADMFSDPLAKVFFYFTNLCVFIRFIKLQVKAVQLHCALLLLLL